MTLPDLTLERVAGIGWKPWMTVVTVLAVAAAGLSLAVSIHFGNRPQPATLTLSNGAVVRCADGRWFGGDFGPDNKFDCDGTVYTITAIDKVVRP